MKGQTQTKAPEKGGLLVRPALLRHGFPQLVHKVLPKSGPDGIQMPGHQPLAGGFLSVGNSGKMLLSQGEEITNQSIHNSTPH